MSQLSCMATFLFFISVILRTAILETLVRWCEWSQSYSFVEIITLITDKMLEKNNLMKISYDVSNVSDTMVFPFIEAISRNLSAKLLTMMLTTT